MCLNKVSWRTRPSKEGKYCWKVFDVMLRGYEDEHMCCPCYSRHTPRVLDERYIVETLTRQIADSGQSYLTGFHSFERKKDAIAWASDGDAVIRVAIEGVLCSGTEKCYHSSVLPGKDGYTDYDVPVLVSAVITLNKLEGHVTVEYDNAAKGYVTTLIKPSKEKQLA